MLSLLVFFTLVPWALVPNFCDCVHVFTLKKKIEINDTPMLKEIGLYKQSCATLALSRVAHVRTVCVGVRGGGCKVFEL